MARSVSMNEIAFVLLLFVLVMAFTLILVWSGVDLRDVSVCKG